MLHNAWIKNNTLKFSSHNTNRIIVTAKSISLMQTYFMEITFWLNFTWVKRKNFPYLLLQNTKKETT